MMELAALHFIVFADRRAFFHEAYHNLDLLPLLDR